MYDISHTAVRLPSSPAGPHIHKTLRRSKHRRTLPCQKRGTTTARLVTDGDDWARKKTRPWTESYRSYECKPRGAPIVSLLVAQRQAAGYACIYYLVILQYNISIQPRRWTPTSFTSTTLMIEPPRDRVDSNQNMLLRACIVRSSTPNDTTPSISSVVPSVNGPRASKRIAHLARYCYELLVSRLISLLHYWQKVN